MKEYERKGLLERIERDGATVGHTIPDEIDLDGDTLALRSFVLEARQRETVPPAERERVDEVKKRLRRERVRRTERIEEGDISQSEGERLADAVIGIDRALNVLADLDPTDVEAEAQRAEAADRKRWRSFLKKALGEDESDRRASR